MTSAWAVGTYELLLVGDPEGDPTDLIVTIFAKPRDPADTTADEDAPVLAHCDVSYAEIGLKEGDTLPWKTGLRDVGMTGLVPEAIESEYGPQMGLRILLSLLQAVRADFYGLDMDGNPWRTPSDGAVFGLMERTHDIMAILNTRLFG